MLKPGRTPFVLVPWCIKTDNTSFLFETAYLTIINFMNHLVSESAQDFLYQSGSRHLRRYRGLLFIFAPPLSNGKVAGPAALGFGNMNVFNDELQDGPRQGQNYNHAIWYLVDFWTVFLWILSSMSCTADPSWAFWSHGLSSAGEISLYVALHSGLHKFHNCHFDTKCHTVNLRKIMSLLLVLETRIMNAGGYWKNNQLIWTPALPAGWVKWSTYLDPPFKGRETNVIFVLYCQGQLGCVS